MKTFAATAAAAAGLALVALAAAGAAPAARPGGGLAVTPTRLILTGHDDGVVTLANPARAPVVAEVETADYNVARGGHVSVVGASAPAPARSAQAWLTLSARRVRIPADGSVDVVVSARAPRLAPPGDHHAVLLVTTSVSSGDSVTIRTRIGIPLLVRVTGPFVRDLRVDRLRVDRSGRLRLLRLGLANRGNIDERLARGQVSIVLRRGGRALTTLTAPARDLLPLSRAVLLVPYGGPIRGLVHAVVRLRPTPAAEAGPHVRRTPAAVARAFTIRL